jgi:hypothetical protein
MIERLHNLPEGVEGSERQRRRQQGGHHSRRPIFQFEQSDRGSGVGGRQARSDDELMASPYGVWATASCWPRGPVPPREEPPPPGPTPPEQPPAPPREEPSVPGSPPPREEPPPPEPPGRREPPWRREPPVHEPERRARSHGPARPSCRGRVEADRGASLAAPRRRGRSSRLACGVIGRRKTDGYNQY